MLVLSRKLGERILIGDDVTITVVRIGPNNVRIGIAAPRKTSIVRQELVDRAISTLKTADVPPVPAHVVERAVAAMDAGDGR